MEKEYLKSLSLKDLKELAESQHETLRLTTSNEQQFRQKVLKVKKDLKDFMKSENSKFIEMEDIQEFTAVTRNIRNLGLGIMVPSFIAACYLKRIPGFRKISRNSEIFLRLFMFFAPVGGIYSYSIDQNNRFAAYFDYKYSYRVQKFNQTKDPRDINPYYKDESQVSS
jgi:hypothetical protein